MPMPERERLDCLIADDTTPLDELFGAVRDLERAVEASEAERVLMPLTKWAPDEFYWERIGGTMGPVYGPSVVSATRSRRWSILDQEWNVFNNTIVGKVKPIRVPVINKLTGEKEWRVACHKMELDYLCHDGTTERWTLVMMKRKGIVSFALTQLEFGKRLLDRLSGEWEEIPYTDRALASQLREMLCAHMLPEEASDVMGYWSEKVDFAAEDRAAKSAYCRMKIGVNGRPDEYATRHR